MNVFHNCVYWLQVPPISTEHFKSAMKVIRPSVSPDSLAAYAKWNAAQGSR